MARAVLKKQNKIYQVQRKNTDNQSNVRIFHRIALKIIKVSYFSMFLKEIIFMSVQSINNSSQNCRQSVFKGIICKGSENKEKNYACK